MPPLIREILLRLSSELRLLYGERLAEVRLYGSYARGNQEPGSDIDVLVVLDGDVDPGEEISRTGRLVSSLSLESNHLISCTFVSAKRYNLEASPLLINLRKESVVL